MKITLSMLIVFFLVSACSTGKETLKKEPPFEPEPAFTQAQDKIKKKRFEEAREIFEKIKIKDTSGEYSPLAQVLIGDSYFKEGLYEEAAVEYGHFLRIHSFHKHSPYAQYQLAMTYFKRIKTADISYAVAQRALKEFEKLLRVYPRNPYVNAVENRMKACNNILAEYEFYVGEFYFKKGSFTAAAGRFNDLLRKYPESDKEPDSLYYLGLSYLNMGEKDKSLKTLSSLVQKYPTIKLSMEAKDIIASLNKDEK
jgi:outer membrane protein assembly factor BamD